MTRAAIQQRTRREIVHDLRTCLNHIIGYGELLEEDLATDGTYELSLVRRLCAAGTSLSDVLDTFSAASAHGALPERIAKQGDEMKNCLQELANGPLVPAAQRSVLEKIEIAVDRISRLSMQWLSAPRELETIRPATSSDAPPPISGRLLVAEDDAGSREILASQLRKLNYDVTEASDGAEVLALLQREPFDLLLLDIMMPELDGIGVLHRMRASGLLKRIPVMMISGLNETQCVVDCIELGAEDYIAKPLDSRLLQARLNAMLERKRLREAEQKKAAELEKALRQLEVEKSHAQTLLLNILPRTVADELREKGSVDPMYFEDVTVVMTDFVGFTLAAARMAADELVETLHEHFTAFDTIVARYGLEKLKTVGDSYIFVGGMPVRNPSHPVDSILAACEMIGFIERRVAASPLSQWKMRVGIHTGPVIAGVVGINKFAFDLWGETVNFCSRLEAASQPNRINLSEKVHARVKDFFACEHRGKVAIKNGADVDMYFVQGILPTLLPANGTLPPARFTQRYQTYFRKEPVAFPDASCFPVPTSEKKD
jgi:adenylate cyclase